MVAVVGAADVSYLRLSARILFSQYTTLGILYFLSLSLNFVNCQFLIEGLQKLFVLFQLTCDAVSVYLQLQKRRKSIFLP